MCVGARLGEKAVGLVQLNVTTCGLRVWYAVGLTGDAVSEMQAPEVADPHIPEHSTTSSMSYRTIDSITDATAAAAAAGGGGEGEEKPQERALALRELTL